MIERIKNPTRETFETFVREHRPVIIEGALDHWGALSKWTPAYLRENVGDPEMVALAVDRTGHSSSKVEKLRFGQFIDVMTRATPGIPEPYYLAGAGVYWGHRKAYRMTDSPYAPLAHDVPLPQLINPTRLQRANIWIGCSETRVPLHFDASDNILAMVAGRKYVKLFAPSETKHLYPMPLHSDPAALSYSQIRDADHVDSALFPRFRHATCLECVLEPGEMLFIPAAYWHYVRSEGRPMHLAVNFWWAVPFLNLLTYPMNRLFVRYLREAPANTTRVLNWALRSAWSHRG